MLSVTCDEKTREAFGNRAHTENDSFVIYTAWSILEPASSPPYQHVLALFSFPTDTRRQPIRGSITRRHAGRLTR
jgi:hypothetical protein